MLVAPFPLVSPNSAHPKKILLGLVGEASRAGNWNGVLMAFPQLTDPKLRSRATACLIRRLRFDAKNAKIIPEFAVFKLQQLERVI